MKVTNLALVFLCSFFVVIYLVADACMFVPFWCV